MDEKNFGNGLHVDATHTGTEFTQSQYSDAVFEQAL